MRMTLIGFSFFFQTYNQNDRELPQLKTNTYI